MGKILNEALRRRTCYPELGWLLLLMMTAVAPARADVRYIHHKLSLQLSPADSVLEVTDRIRLPGGAQTSWRFSLGDAFEVETIGGRLHPLDGGMPGRFREYRLEVDAVPTEVTLRYRGRVVDNAARADHGMPIAVLDERGVFLDGASGWYPSFEGTPVTFRLQADLPSGWESVSQGRRLDTPAGPVWEAVSPQDDIYFIAGPFTRYAEPHRGIELEVYLLAPEDRIARRYLEVMGQYIDFYSALVADYPYPKFAVVENRWQTGYGMPSFTLLGSRVLRLPFILHSSLPHEILHNWWGNGVYLDLQAGNWSEGLTAYLSDHLIREAQGQGAVYRRQALERYASYAAEGRDFPVRRFRARHSDASQAVGYAKVMMLFHMLRRELGDPTFVAALKAFWETWRFQAAGFAEVKAVMEQTAGRPLQALHDLWLDRPGAPELALKGAESRALGESSHALRLTLAQTQSGPPYPLSVPVAVQLVGEVRPVWREVALREREVTVEWTFERPLARVDVDPNFDVFRLLDARERPPALARLFGAQIQLLVLPSDAPEGELSAWQALASGWARRYDNVRVAADREIDVLPNDQAVWLLGWDNLWLKRTTERFASQAQALTSQALRLRGQTYARADYAVVALDSDNGREPLGFIGAPDPSAIGRLARKLPHYGRYGRLVFEGVGLTNLLSEDLPVPSSPLSRSFAAADPGPPPSPNPPLTELVGVRLEFNE